MLAFGRNDPQAARTRDVQITSLIDLHSVECVFTFSRGHIKEDFAINKTSVRLNFIPHDDLFLCVPVVDVEVLLVWREGESVRASEVSGKQLDSFPIWRDSIHAAVRQFLARVVKEFWKAEWRVGEVKRAIGLVDQIVRAVEPLAVVMIGQDRKLPIFLHADNAAVAVLVDREAPFLIAGETVRSGLAIFADIETAIAALGHEDRELTVLCPAINKVVVGITE